MQLCADFHAGTSKEYLIFFLFPIENRQTNSEFTRSASAHAQDTRKEYVFCYQRPSETLSLGRKECHKILVEVIWTRYLASLCARPFRQCGILQNEMLFYKNGNSKRYFAKRKSSKAKAQKPDIPALE